MIATPRGTQDPLLQELNRTIKEPWARLALAYDQRQPQLLRVVVNALQLVNSGSTGACVKLCKDLLKGLVRIDCGFYYLAREWCLVHGPGQGEATEKMRQRLLGDLQGALAAPCSKVLLAFLAQKAGGAPPRAPQAKHLCWSVAGHRKAGGASSVREARIRQSSKSVKPSRRARQTKQEALTAQ